MNYQQITNNRSLAYPVSKPVPQVKRRSTQQLGCDNDAALHIPSTLLTKKDTTTHTTCDGREYVAPPVDLFLRACREEFELTAAEDGLPSLQDMIDMANNLGRRSAGNVNKKYSGASGSDGAQWRSSSTPDTYGRVNDVRNQTGDKTWKPRSRFDDFEDDFDYFDYGFDDAFDHDIPVEPLIYDPVTGTITSSTCKSLCVVANTDEERYDMVARDPLPAVRQLTTVDEVSVQSTECAPVSSAVSPVEELVVDDVLTTSHDVDVVVNTVAVSDDHCSTAHDRGQSVVDNVVADHDVDAVVSAVAMSDGHRSTAHDRGQRAVYRRGAFGAKRIYTSFVVLSLACVVMSQGHWVEPRGPRDRPKYLKGSYLDNYWNATHRFLYDPEMKALLPMSIDQSMYYDV